MSPQADYDPVDLVSERKKTHGDWAFNSFCIQMLKETVQKLLDYRKQNGLGPLTAQQREALDMFCVKEGRIIAGNPDEPDHWDDIAGYALLGKKGHDDGQPVPVEGAYPAGRDS